MKLGLAMIVKGDDKEARMLNRCLSYVAEHVDGIFITVTQPNEKVVEVAKKYNAHVSHFEWCKDFSKARNFNFAQVPKEYDYILWLDADDALRGAEKLKPTIEEHPRADTFAMMYLYAFDENKNPTVAHQKTRVIRNDGCVEWVGPIHEDLKKNRECITHSVTGIEVLHLSNEARMGENMKRNVEIARKMVKDKPEDPRSYWNLGNSLKGAGEVDEAIVVLNKFLKLSKADEEKYLVYLRLANLHLMKGNSDKALDLARYAVGLRPEYPDAYYSLGFIYHHMRLLEEARDSILLGLVKKPPYFSIIVFNPRDYDAVPLKMLAKVYFELAAPIQALECLRAVLQIYPKDEGLKTGVKMLEKKAKKEERVLKIIERIKDIKDKEVLKKELKKIPKDFQSHPGICTIRNTNFVKEESSGKDVVFYCGYTKAEWTPETVKKTGIGGSEEAVIHLTRRWKEMGYNVTVYNNCGYKEQVIDGVTWKPYWTWNYRDKQDIVILWRSLRGLDYEINAPKIFVDLHDVILPGELNEKRLGKLTKIFVKSKFHRDLFPKAPDDKFVVIPNGIDSELFEQELERDNNLLINTSSPDRSMSTLIELFKKVKEQVPHAKLKWAYGWEVFDIVHANDKEQLDWKANIVKQMAETEGVEDLGRITHEEVAKLYLTAGVFAYPTEFAEIHCISAAKAQAGGAYPVATDFAALEETIQYGEKVHSPKTKDNWAKDYQFDFALEGKKEKEEWVKKCVHALQNPPSDEKREEMRKWARETFNWDKIARNWDDVFKGGTA